MSAFNLINTLISTFNEPQHSEQISTQRKIDDIETAISQNDAKDSLENNERSQQTQSEIKVDNIAEVTESTEEKIKQVDEQLRIYYEENEKKDYWKDGENQGKFATWCDDNGYDDSHLEEEFNADAVESIVIDFDEDFPLNPKIEDEEQRNEKIFKILKTMYQGHELVFLDDFNLNVTEEQIVETRKKYREHIKTWGTDDDFTQLTDINILYFLTVSRIDKGMNLLLNIIDSYKRDITAELVKNRLKMEEDTKDMDIIDCEINADQERLDKWILNRPFLKELNEELKVISTKLNNAKIEAGFVGKQQWKTTNKKCKLDLKKLIQTYPKRIGTRLRLSSRLIDDDLEMVSKCIVASAKFIDQLIYKETEGIGGVPCLIDFIILLNPSLSDDKFNIIDHRPANIDSDDDDGEYSKHIDGMIQVADDSGKIVYEDIIGDVIQHLKHNKCKMHVTNVSDMLDQKGDIDAEAYDQIARKCIKDAFTELRSQVKGQDGKYPRNGRINVMIDRRDFYKFQNKDKDKLIVYEPPSDCCKLSDINIPECYFDLSRQCLIPRPGYVRWEDRMDQDEKVTKTRTTKLKTETITATKASQGQTLTLSYHIWEAEEIKCYLLWNGQCHRFYPQDILELLPHIFRKDKNNKEFVESDEAKRLIMEMVKCIKDSKFERFYRGINKLSKYQFPRQYRLEELLP